jgi:hypothetical protein
MIGPLGNPAIAPPTDTLTVLIFVLPQTFKYGRRLLQNHRHDDPAFLSVRHAPPGDRLHPVKEIST